jgi:leucyl/phenylalanyl-tRNA--protein transferase
LTPGTIYNQLYKKSGIFPWFEDGEPIIWWSPNPRIGFIFG